MGSAWPLEEELNAEIRGRDLVTGLPKTIVITTRGDPRSDRRARHRHRRRGEGHARQDAARAGRRHHGARHHDHRRRRVAHRTRTIASSTRPACRSTSPTIPLQSVAIGSGQALEEFDALRGVLFKGPGALTSATKLDGFRAHPTSGPAPPGAPGIGSRLHNSSHLGRPRVDAYPQLLGGRRRRVRPGAPGPPSHVFQPVENAWNGVFRLRPLKKENEASASRSMSLKGKQAQATPPRPQIRNCSSSSSCLGRRTSPPGGRGGDRPRRTSTRRSRSTGAASKGVEVGMPVVDGGGPRRQGGRRQQHRASCRLITDPDFRRASRLPRLAPSSASSTAHGRDRIPSRSDLIDANASAHEGGRRDHERRPAEPVPRQHSGRVVSEFHKDPGELQLTVKVEPAADLTNLGVVKIIVWKPEG